MIYLNENEEKIIGKFIEVEDKYENNALSLVWKNGDRVEAKYDSFIEDENDCELEDENYEEFWSFIFKKIEIEGNPPIEVTEDGYFLINYHNFPQEILVDGKKIN